MKYIVFALVYIPVFVVVRYIVKGVSSWLRKRNMAHK